jgi:hypothetical protein
LDPEYITAILGSFTNPVLPSIQTFNQKAHPKNCSHGHNYHANNRPCKEHKTAPQKFNYEERESLIKTAKPSSISTGPNLEWATPNSESESFQDQICAISQKEEDFLMPYTTATSMLQSLTGKSAFSDSWA